MITAALIAAAVAAGPVGSAATAAAQLSPAQEQYRVCIAHRESNDNPRARSKISSAAGRYQFLDSKWRRGLSHMVTKRLRDHGLPRPVAAALRKDLAATPIDRWAPILQDVGFAAALNAQGPWSGAKHWRYGDRCDRLVPR